VDDTKFRLAGDFLNDMSKPDAALTDWKAWEVQKDGGAMWTKSSARVMADEFKTWTEESHSNYDEHCELSDRLKDPPVRDRNRNTPVPGENKTRFPRATGVRGSRARCSLIEKSERVSVFLCRLQRA
jgi:hypothetical protein